MTAAQPGPAGEARQALAAGLVCYLLWGVFPILFMAIGRAGASPWEIVGERAVWSAPCALVLALAAGQGRETLAALRTPRTLGALLLSALLIGSNWLVFVWAVSSRRNLEASLGYYINPLFNMAVGAVFFRERINRVGYAAMALAGVGVALQAAALGRPPWVSLVLAASFCAYGAIRKRAAAPAQAGLLVECLFMLAPGGAYVAWLAAHHAGLAASGPAGAALLALTGPATVIPLALFSWSARRLAFSTVGFIQFVSPTLGFLTGLATGEPLTPLGVVSFVFIWAGAAVFAAGALRAARRLQRAGA